MSVNEQLSLIDGDSGVSQRADELDDVRAAFPSPPRTGRAGRPPGAKNRKSLAIQAYYSARGFRDPLNYLGDLVTSDPIDLWHWFRDQTRRVKGEEFPTPSLLDIVDLQRRAATDLAPYLHGKQPLAVDDDGRALPVLIINTGTNQVARKAAAGRALSVGQPLDEAEAEDKQNQGVSGADAD